MARRPALAAAAVFSLALGIGAKITIFSVLHAVVLNPLPYEPVTASRSAFKP
ncbi:MAG: hypothetical protein H0T71_09870 [Acidobacteria bacterium]|nr:hypothetical protein [Acidobacteriota bacterium]